MANFVLRRKIMPEQTSAKEHVGETGKLADQQIAADGTMVSEPKKSLVRPATASRRTLPPPDAVSGDPLELLCNARLASLNVPPTFKVSRTNKTPAVVRQALKLARNAADQEEVMSFYELLMKSAASENDETRTVKILNAIEESSPSLYFTFCRKPILEPSRVGKFTRDLIGILGNKVRHRNDLVKRLALFTARRLSGDLSARAPLLVGPPGTGKSYIISMLAEAVSQAGVRTEPVMQQMTQSGRRDQNEEVPMRLLGTSKKYSNSEPGTIFSALTSRGTEATVVFLDEAEKGGMRDFMVSLLDPKMPLEDSFVKEVVGKMDMRRHTLFVLAANDGERFSSCDEDPLGTRVERIFVPPYDADQLRLVLMELAAKDMAAYGVCNEGKIAAVVAAVLDRYGASISLRMLEDAVKEKLFADSVGIELTPPAPCEIQLKFMERHRRPIGFRMEY